MQISEYAHTVDGKVVVIGEELSSYDVHSTRDNFVRVDIKSARTKTDAGFWIRQRTHINGSRTVDDTCFVSIKEMQEVVKNCRKKKLSRR